MIFLYYRKSEDIMVLVNTEPDSDWKKLGRDNTCEIYLKNKQIDFDWANLSLLPAGKEQNLVSYALRINIIGEPGDEYRD